jgi:hypothetical protein
MPEGQDDRFRRKVFYRSRRTTDHTAHDFQAEALKWHQSFQLGITSVHQQNRIEHHRWKQGGKLQKQSSQAERKAFSQR